MTVSPSAPRNDSDRRDPGSSHDVRLGSQSRVADFLTLHRDAIFDKWIDRVTSEARDVELTGLALRDDVPELLDELALWLSSGTAPDHSTLAQHAVVHVIQRLDAGLPLAQVFREYRILRETILESVLNAEAVEQTRACAGGGKERVDRIKELACLNLGLDVVLSQSIEHFVQERDRRAAADRVAAAQAVQLSELRYRALFESIDEGFCIIEVLFDGQRPVDYRFIHVNPAFERHTGLVGAAGKCVRELVPDLDGHWFKIYGEVASTGEPTRFQNVAAALGRYFDVYAFRIGEPQQAQVAVLFNDITVRKRQEASLAILSDVSGVLAAFSSLETSVTQIGAALGRHFCVTQCLLMQHTHGPDNAVVAHGWHADEAPDLRGTLRVRDFVAPEVINALQRGEAIAVGDVQLEPRVSSERVTPLGIRSFVLVPLPLQHEWQFVMLIASCQPRAWREEEIDLLRDLIARIAVGLERAEAEEALRASEARFRALTTATSDLIYRMSPYWLELRELHGRGFLADTVAPSNPWIHTYIHPDDQPRLLSVIAEAIKNRRPFESEQRVLRADGSVGWTWSRAVPLLDADGDIEEWFGAASDITERKRAEVALNEANFRLAEADRRKDDFLAMLSHELRNPLAPISNSLYILEHAPSGGDQAARARAVIGRQIAQLASLVNDLLDVTRIARSKVHLQKEKLDLVEALRAAVEDHRSLFAQAGVDLELSVPPHAIHVDADRTRLAQIVGNLLQNSAKFTARGGYTKVSVDAIGEQAMVRVIDNGVGIAPQTLERLFQPFAQAEQTLDRSKGGLGLGLALVKGLIELHGGSVDAHSAGLGQGLEVRFRLPIAAAPRVGTLAWGAALKSARRRVLIIEDNIDAAETLRDALTLNGHEVAVAYNGPDGIVLAHELKPDLVFCDLGLPVMDGFAVARALRAAPELRRAVLVALSGYTMPEDQQRALEAGFDRHLAKPPSFAEIERLLAGQPPVSGVNAPGPSTGDQ